MKYLKNFLPLLLVVLMFFTTGSTAVVSAATNTKIKYYKHTPSELELTLDGKAVDELGHIVNGKDTYYRLSDIARLLKNTTKKFNFKYDTKKKTITVYRGTKLVAKNIDALITATADEETLSSKTAAGYFFDRDNVVYVNDKKVSVNALVYANGFYMKIEDIAKVANFGVSYDKKRTKADISVKRKYAGVEEIVTSKKLTTKAILGNEGIADVEDSTGIIKPMFKDAKFIESPKTTKDFEQLIKYMMWKGITTCTIETNVLYDKIHDDGGILDEVYNVTLFDVYGGLELIKDFAVSTKGVGSNTEIKISLKGYNNESAKTLATKLQKYYTGINEVLLKLISDGKLTKSMTEKEKAKVLVKWVDENVEYDSKGTSEGRYTGSGALFDRLAVCDGQTKVYVTLCHSIGLYDTYFIAGTATNSQNKTGTHAWVGQILDGEKVMTDPTWYYDIGGVEKYFAISIKEMQKNHFYDTNKYLDWK